MSLKGCDCKWYDGFFLAMIATSAVVVSINWLKYSSCTYPLHIWIMIDYATVFVFRVLMFIDSWLAAGLGPDINHSEQQLRFHGRIVILSCLALVFYPFLWAWTVIGSLWFASARSCLPEEGQKWGFLIWLLFSYCGLVCVACISTGKWLMRRQAHLLQAQQGTPISELEVLVDLIRVPDWAYQSAVAGQELRGNGQETASYHPGLYLSPTQREAIESLIQQLPKFRLKAVPTECSECPICLEEFHVGNEVRGLPCAHNFHVTCIDEWLRLNIKCPRCRCSVFPNLDLSALASHPQRGSGVTSIYFGGDAPRMSTTHGTAAIGNGRYIQAEAAGQSNLLHMQENLRTMRIENGTYSDGVADEARSHSVELNSGYIQGSDEGRQRGGRNITFSDAHQRAGLQGQNPYTISESLSVVVRSPPARF